MEVFSEDDFWAFHLWLHICHFAIDRKLDFRKSVSHVSPKNTEFLTRADSNYWVEPKAVPLFLTKTRVTLLKSRPLLRICCNIPNEVTCHCAPRSWSEVVTRYVEMFLYFILYSIIVLRKLNIWSRLRTSKQDKIVTKWNVVNPLKEWNSSNIWEQP